MLAYTFYIIVSSTCSLKNSFTVYQMKSFNSRMNLSDLAARQTGSLIDCGLSEDVLVVDQLDAGLFS